MARQLDVQITKKEYVINRKAVEVLREVNFTVGCRQFGTLLGPSGCGKTTIFRLLLGLERDYEGSLLIDGRPITGPGLDRGIVFQEPRLIPWVSVRKNIEFAIPDGRYGPQMREHVSELIRIVGMNGFEDAWPRQLSGGMAQRVAIARALVNVPELLLMDEPFGALDSHTRMAMQQELLAIHERERTTTLMVTHDVDEAVYLSDVIVVLSEKPAKTRQIIPVTLPKPRSRTDPHFTALRSHVLDAFYG